jgi:hypothetical protein
MNENRNLQPAFHTVSTVLFTDFKTVETVSGDEISGWLPHG